MLRPAFSKIVGKQYFLELLFEIRLILEIDLLPFPDELVCIFVELFCAVKLFPLFVACMLS